MRPVAETEQICQQMGKLRRIPAFTVVKFIESPDKAEKRAENVEKKRGKEGGRAHSPKSRLTVLAQKIKKRAHSILCV